MTNTRELNREEQSLRAPGHDAETVTPSIDIYETDAGHVLLADMPGVSSEGLDIHVERDRLTIRGRVAVADGPRPQYREFVLHDYYRAFTLADDVDTEHIKATLNDGVLRLELPKAESARVRRIPVNAH